MILALPHLGGWEWAGRWWPTAGYQMTVVVEPLEPPELFEWFADLRKDLGMTVVPLGPEAGTRRDAGAARQPGRVPAVRPRHRAHGVEVEFFGERTTLPGGAGHAGAAHRRADRCRPACTSPTASTATTPGVRPPIAAERARGGCATTSLG